MSDNSRNQQRDDANKKTHHHETDSDLASSGGRENASSNRGGTTDLDQGALTVDRDDRTKRGSGISTKNTVAGSDFDGQLSE